MNTATGTVINHTELNVCVDIFKKVEDEDRVEYAYSAIMNVEIKNGEFKLK